MVSCVGKERADQNTSIGPQDQRIFPTRTFAYQNCFSMFS